MSLVKSMPVAARCMKKAWTPQEMAMWNRGLILIQQNDLTQFFSYLMSTGLKHGLFEAKQNITIFAPRNAAFDAGIHAKLDGMSDAAVIQILKYHIIPGIVKQANIANSFDKIPAGQRPVIPNPTLAENQVLCVSKNGSSITVSNGNIIKTDIQLTPQILVHVIDMVLMPVSICT